MDTDSLSKIDRAISTVSKDTKKNCTHTHSYFDSGGEQFDDGRRQRGKARGGGGRQPCCTWRQGVCL